MTIRRTGYLFALFFSNLHSNVIDVVIPCVKKDQVTLNQVINGIRCFGKDIRRIIVVSAEPLTRNAEWFPESNYPFNKYDVAQAIFGDKEVAQKFVDKSHSRIGWIYQQLLKFYAPFVIPNISENVLILDADLIFIKPTEFIDKDGQTLFSTSDEYHKPYFAHAARLIPGFQKIYPSYSGIVHHMLFQKDILQNLFDIVETVHGKKFWVAFCEAIDKNWVELSSASEYEIYFNFMFQRYPQRAKIRQLRKVECWTLDAMNRVIVNRTQERYDCVGCQEWRRR